MEEIEYSIIQESYTTSEGGLLERLGESIRRALRMLPDDGRAELILTDVFGSPELERLLADDFPQVRRVLAVGLPYDEAKMLAAKAARGRYLLFLDGDCLPESNWNRHLLETLRGNRGVVACGGYTRYEGRFLAAIMSVMDFGFFYPLAERELKCYASNNCAFLKEELLETPMVAVDIRCSCYNHTQRLLRHGTPMWLVPDARVLHEMQPILRERTRQGYDVIAARWADPALPQAKWLRWGIFSLPLFYALQIWLDWSRLWAGQTALGISPWQAWVAVPMFPLFRLLDAVGMARAFIRGREQGGWGGWAA